MDDVYNNNKYQYIREHSKYIADASLLVIDNFQENVFSISFLNVWPTNLGSVSLNYREGESDLECQVTFAYDRYEIKNDFQ
jgi:hypothetical protein